MDIFGGPRVASAAVFNSSLCFFFIAPGRCFWISPIPRVPFFLLFWKSGVCSTWRFWKDFILFCQGGMECYSCFLLSGDGKFPVPSPFLMPAWSIFSIVFFPFCGLYYYFVSFWVSTWVHVLVSNCRYLFYMKDGFLPLKSVPPAFSSFWPTPVSDWIKAIRSFIRLNMIQSFSWPARIIWKQF